MKAKMSKGAAWFRGVLGVLIAVGGYLLNDETVRALIPLWLKVGGGAVLAGALALRLWLDQSLSLSDPTAPAVASPEAPEVSVTISGTSDAPLSEKEQEAA